MRKRGFWLTLLIAAIAVLFSGWNWYGALTRSPNPSTRPILVQTQATVAPTIDSQRLWQDLEALSFKRFTDADRQQARDYIIQALQEAGWQPQQQSFDRGINLYAERTGTNPEAGTILLGAHYDTVEQAAGADDNATAVATILETARLLAQMPLTRSLQLVLFDREEEGLLGSKAFVEQMSQRQNLQGAVIMDMIGYACHTAGCQSYPPLPITPSTNKGEFLAIIGDQGHQPLINSFVQTQASGLPQLLTLPIPTFGGLLPDLVRSDHAPFWRAGLGAVLVTDTANFRNPNYHQPSDDLETIDRPFFEGAAQIVVNAVTELVQGQGSLVTAARERIKDEG